MTITSSTFRSDTRTVTIGAAVRRVFDFVADGGNLPRWAIGFARDARATGDNQWVVTTGQGAQVAVEIACDPTAGTVDFHMTPAPGITAVACAESSPMDREASSSSPSSRPRG